MMKYHSNSFLILLVLPILFLASCKIEKRLYRPGYHVEWKGQKANSSNANVNSHTAKNKIESAADYTSSQWPKEIDFQLTASVQQKDVLSTGYITIPSSFQYPDQTHIRDMPCDTVYLLSNEQLIVRLIEVTLDKVTYKRCDLPKGPLYVIKLGEVDYIVYGNGDVDYIANPTPPIKDAEIPEEESGRTGDIADGDSTETLVEARGKLEIFGLIAFLISIIGILIVYAVPVAMLLAIFSLLRHNNPKMNFKGIGFAQAALFISILALAAYLMIGPILSG